MPPEGADSAIHPVKTGIFALLRRRYRAAYAEPRYIPSVILSFGAFLLSLVISSYAIVFATDRASNPVTDLILSNTPALDVDGIYVYGAICLIVFIAIIILAYPKRIPFTLYSLALFFVIRAAFVTMTHLGPFTPQTGIDFGATVQRMFFGDDYFFSGHTGSPFLMALVYWREKYLRYIFLAWSVFFGAVVLLGHLHYSIDVFAAFFITFAIYHMALYLFPRSHARFSMDEPISLRSHKFRA
jgi:hypothetical protein